LQVPALDRPLPPLPWPPCFWAPAAPLAGPADCATLSPTCSSLRATLSAIPRTSADSEANVITFAPGVTLITLGSDLPLPPLSTGGSITVAGPPASGARLNIAAAAGAYPLVRLDSGTEGTYMHFQGIDFYDVRFRVTKAALRLTDCGLKADAAQLRPQAFYVAAERVFYRVGLSLTRVTVEGFRTVDLAAGTLAVPPGATTAAGAAVYAQQATVDATGKNAAAASAAGHAHGSEAGSGREGERGSGAGSQVQALSDAIWGISSHCAATTSKAPRMRSYPCLQSA
jgi:hypothetical protein